ncbi:hypothetical protein P12x_003012 [Tundrisphaera lichenicola]|uniref:hypothetical protein n=1 Tax=Tundrisphaera lichenicola TaxID=2029860 RepID=UPI003EB88B8B
MTTAAAAKEILTVAELAERWGVSTDTVMARVEDPETPLSAIALGRPEGKKRRRLVLRFRIETVRAWERDQERRLAPEPRAEPAGRPAGYEGKIHTRPRKGRGGH